ncbi:hypothetical protein, partial [Staphylococcus aureus]|uniref:hypothetical protein n=1 Tax=Staphylococcus aureus TaxID=1280 RepID=UPI00301BA7F0
EDGRGTTRATILPAYIEIMLAVEDMPAAQAGADELAEMAGRLDAPFLRALAAGARGAIRLAEGDPRAALGPLREACRFWEDLEVPYELARTRGLIGRACERLGDADSARMEFDTARWYLRELGASPEL